MKFTSELSLKIRTAIKVKLAELGNDVYEELPDYIMVMVANKKSEEQMTEDLTLFLGDNTDQFTSWLHSLISKLQSIAADSVMDKRTLAKPRPNESATTTPCDSESEQSNQDASSCAILGSDEASTSCMNAKDEAVSVKSRSSTVDADSTSKSSKHASTSVIAHNLDDNGGLIDTYDSDLKKDAHKRKTDLETRIIRVKARKLDPNVPIDKGAAKECPAVQKISKVHRNKTEDSNKDEIEESDTDRNAISSSAKSPNADSFTKVDGEVSSSVEQTELSKCEEPTDSKDMQSPLRETVQNKTKNKIQLKRL